MYENGVTKITFKDDYSNIKEIEEFVGGFWKCTICGGSGEYEGEYGPVSCGLCNSRLLPFIDGNGKLVMADWGDDIVKDENGKLRLIENHLND
jgi:hypothetical protein